MKRVFAFLHPAPATQQKTQQQINVEMCEILIRMAEEQQALHTEVMKKLHAIEHTIHMIHERENILMEKIRNETTQEAAARTLGDHRYDPNFEQPSHRNP